MNAKSSLPLILMAIASSVCVQAVRAEPISNHAAGAAHLGVTGPVDKLAEGFRITLDAQANAKETGSHSSEHSPERVWRFDDASAGRLPEQWTIGATHPKGEANPWSVQKQPHAPSSDQVLALIEPKNYERGTFNLCWTDEVAFQNGAIQVSLKAASGEIDQGGGPIWRVRDANNYYVARWNPLEDNIRLYYVKDGKRVQLATADVETDPKAWHTIRITHSGDLIECYFDGKKLLNSRDQTFPQSGGIGLWTKADAATAFDDLMVRAEP